MIHSDTNHPAARRGRGPVGWQDARAEFVPGTPLAAAHVEITSDAEMRAQPPGADWTLAPFQSPGDDLDTAMKAGFAIGAPQRGETVPDLVGRAQVVGLLTLGFAFRRGPS